jgi:inorganic triphosphatase YgiF
VLLTLDRGWIVANGRREAISEVELELAGAPVHSIFAIATQLAQRVALTPAVLSKAERGYRLHTGTPPTPFKAAAVALSPPCRPARPFAASPCPASNTCSRTITAP